VRRDADTSGARRSTPGNPSRNSEPDIASSDREARFAAGADGRRRGPDDGFRCLAVELEAHAVIALRKAATRHIAKTDLGEISELPPLTKDRPS
jgi:hypothetical protein